MADSSSSKWKFWAKPAPSVSTPQLDSPPLPTTLPTAAEPTSNLPTASPFKFPPGHEPPNPFKFTPSPYFPWTETALNPLLDEYADLSWHSFSEPAPLLPLPIPRVDYHNRLNSTFPDRIWHVCSWAFSGGSLIGTIKSYNSLSLIFRAENAHRQPKTKMGWYNYHKQKNIKVLNLAMNQGMRRGIKTMGLMCMFTVAEDAVDKFRGKRDVISSMLAGLGCAGLISVWAKLGRGYTLATARRGLGIGLAMGLVHDWNKGLHGYGSGPIFSFFGWKGLKDEAVDAEPDYYIQDMLEECWIDQRNWENPTYRKGIKERLLAIEAQLQQKKEEKERKRERWWSILSLGYYQPKLKEGERMTGGKAEEVWSEGTVGEQAKAVWEAGEKTIGEQAQEMIQAGKA